MDSDITIRPAVPGDVPDIWELIRELAEYEKLEHQIEGDRAALREHLFGERPYIEALVAERAGQVDGYALFFYNYSTFLTRPGLYLEDLYVRPQARGRGLGRALLVHLGALALARGAGRFEWTVLDWNESAIRFYESLGAEVLPDWRVCRVTGPALRKLANGAASG